MKSGKKLTGMVGTSPLHHAPAWLTSKQSVMAIKLTGQPQSMCTAEAFHLQRQQVFRDKT